METDLDKHVGKQRDAAMWYRQGFPVSYIAYLLGVSETTVYGYLKKAGIKLSGPKGKTWRRDMRKFFGPGR